MSEANKAIIRRLIEDTWNKKNPSLIDEVISPDYVGHGPGDDIHGLDGHRQLYDTFTTAFPDFNLAIEELLAEGDSVAFRFTLSGTHEGDLMGVPPSGNQVSVNGFGTFRITGGKIAENHFGWDTLSLMQQVGAIPS